MNEYEDHTTEPHVEQPAAADVHADGDGGFWEQYLHLLTDPAHLAYEITFTLVFDILVITFLYGVVLKKIIIPRLRRSIHAEIHAEHGDNPDHCEVVPSEDSSKSAS